jgi:SAM-dependent methyltransferase
VSEASSGVHAAARLGFAQNAADYERARPEYPPTAVDFLIDRLELRPGRTVFDVGAGTGKLARLLVASGATVIAVEPVESMRNQFARVLPDLMILDATAERLPFDPDSADAIVCAQAFHWFSTTEVLAEFARVLGAGRPLGLVWNVRDMSVRWVQQFTELLRPYEGDRPDHNRGHWRTVFDGDVPFTALETTSFVHEQTMTPDLLVARAASMSFVGALDAETRTELLARVHGLGASLGSTFLMPYRTDVHIARRK